MTDPRPPVAFFWGDDAYGLEAATETLRRDAARFPDGTPERWPMVVDPGSPRSGIAELAERVATGVMFGSGILAVVRGASGAARRAADREAILEALASIAPGNGLVFLEEVESGTKEPPGKAIADAVRAAGGEVRRFEAPREGALAAWIEARAREHQIALAPGAAKELASRVGGFVREGDIDRRNQGRQAVTELKKLALRRADGSAVTVDDVQALVREVDPGTKWGFVDAVANRRRDRALELLEPLLDEEPAPVLLAVLHRRLRELIEVKDRLAAGEPPGSLVRSMKLAAYPAELRVRESAAWTADDLDAALEGLLELDALVKGVGGRGADG
ncbi:MAG TPA: DNA polymerase III subunit delta, partial [Candidatus Binatus sp.]|nr:DNA polymerase III subunit delta [Candidatus Binatus sp.]